ncbi:MAG TPA: hypothetical protein VGW33_01940 [Terriglobia bacterium]|nr:hypothetical protein [Terriglobia bacterium]
MINLHYTRTRAAARAFAYPAGVPMLTALAAAAGLVVLAGAFLLTGENAWAQTCSPSFVATPINDLATGTYQGFEGGLYGGGMNTAPAQHDADGKTFAAEVQPLDQDGSPSATGKIVFMSIGPSLAQQEWGTVITQTAQTPGVNHTTLKVVDGAIPQYTTCRWNNAYGVENGCVGVPGRPNAYDYVRDHYLAPAGVTELQVQAIWAEMANDDPSANGFMPLCNPSMPGCVNSKTTTEALNQEAELGQIVVACKTRYPNLKLFFVSGNLYSGYTIVPTSPEPYAYEYGFSNQFLITAQIAEVANGTDIDPLGVVGDVNYTDGVAPWVGWSGYLWADGCIPRSDGLVWLSDDYLLDGLHPSVEGRADAAAVLLADFTVDPYTTPWFLAPVKKRGQASTAGDGHPGNR